eukprot:scaffold1285_cov34-Prasinocladus_malaysianus.AAC.1
MATHRKPIGKHRSVCIKLAEHTEVSLPSIAQQANRASRQNEWRTFHLHHTTSRQVNRGKTKWINE